MNRIWVDELANRLSLVLSRDFAGKILNRDIIGNIKSTLDVEIVKFLERNNLTVEMDKSNIEVVEAIEVAELLAGVKTKRVEFDRNAYDTLVRKVGIENVDKILKELIEDGIQKL